MYDSDVSTTTTALQNANPTVFSDQTISNILALATRDNATVRFDKVGPDANGNVTVASGAEVVQITSSDTNQTTVNPPSNAPVVIFQGRGGVKASFNDGAPSDTQPGGDRIIVGSSGNDRINLEDSRDNTVILGSGNSTVLAGRGEDTVEAGLGDSTIVGGGGGDYAVVDVSNGSDSFIDAISSNSSSFSAANLSITQSTTNTFNIDLTNGNSITVIGATDIASLRSSIVLILVADRQAATAAPLSAVKLTDGATGHTTTISQIQYVDLGNGNALVIARDTFEASIAAMYHTAFGRTADAAGLDYWFDLARTGVTLKQVASAFTGTQEFVAAHIGQDDTGFVQSLYRNTFGRTGEDAGVSYWVNQLAHGATKADLIASFAQIAGQSIAGTSAHQEATVVGSVLIVQNYI